MVAHAVIPALEMLEKDYEQAQGRLHYMDTPSKRKQNTGKDLSGFLAHRMQPPVPPDNMDQRFEDGEGKPLRVLGLKESQIGG